MGQEQEKKKPGGLTGALVVAGTLFVVVFFQDTLPSPTRYIVACLVGGALAALGYLIETKLIKK